MLCYHIEGGGVKPKYYIGLQFIEAGGGGEILHCKKIWGFKKDSSGQTIAISLLHVICKIVLSVFS